MPADRIEVARTAVVDQLVAMYNESLSHTVSHLGHSPQHFNNPLYAYTLGVDSWRVVARRAIPLSAHYASRANLCMMCTLRGLEEVYRSTLTVQLRNVATGDDEPIYDLTDALTAVLTGDSD